MGSMLGNSVVTLKVSLEKFNFVFIISAILHYHNSTFPFRISCTYWNLLKLLKFIELVICFIFKFFFILLLFSII